MKTKVVSAKLDRVASQLLVIFALDAAEKKQAAKPVIKLMTANSGVAKATASVLSSGEFAAGSCETVLLHAPAGCKAERILLVGLAKLTTAEVRKAAGAAVRLPSRASCAKSRSPFRRGSIPWQPREPW